MTTLYMLIGVPGSGKSTWLNRQSLNTAQVLSTDDYIQARATELNSTYSEVFDQFIKPATAQLELDLESALAAEKVIYWDQTNTTVKSRAAKLRKIPSDYRKVAVYFATPEALVFQRLEARGTATGKWIPSSVVRSMIQTLEQPTLSEGFDEIRTLNEPHCYL
jgi:predicted kinase